MRILLTFIFLNLFALTYSQINSENFGGQFGWSGPEEGDPWGELIIYPNSDTTFLFYLNSSRGNSDEIGIITGQAIKYDYNKFEYINLENNYRCKIIFEFKGEYYSVITQKDFNKCTCKAINNLNENFMKESNDIPDHYYIEDKIKYFKDMKIE